MLVAAVASRYNPHVLMTGLLRSAPSYAQS